MAEPKDVTDSVSEPQPQRLWHPMLNTVDCMRGIFSYLSLKDRRSVELTCKSWRDIVKSVPMRPFVLTISCERSPPPRFLVQFEGVFYYVPFVYDRLEHMNICVEDGVPIRMVSTRRQEDPGDIACIEKMNAFFRRLFSTYGHAISALNFGGDASTVSEVEAALSEACVPNMPLNLLRELSESAWKNLTSISLRSVVITSDVWIPLAETVHDLAIRGALETFCVHAIPARDSQPNLIMPLSDTIQDLKRFSCSGIPYNLVTGIGQAASVRQGLREMFIPMHQHFLVTAQNTDQSYLAVLKAADIIDFELHINNYFDVGVAEAVSEALRTVGRRLRMLDLRLWWPSRLDAREMTPPISTIMPDLVKISDSMEEFRFYGSDTCLNNDTLSRLVDYLADAPKLRCLSLGKVCSRRVKNYRPLGNLTNLEKLYLSFCSRLDNTQLLEIVDCLINLKRLWVLESPLITEEAILSVMNRLEAIEIAKCGSFTVKRFFQKLLASRREIQGAKSATASASEPSALIDNLEFVKIRGCPMQDLKYLQRSIRAFEQVGVRVSIHRHYHEVIFIMKNYGKWSNISSIRLPWYHCEFCGADLHPR